MKASDLFSSCAVQGPSMNTWVVAVGVHGGLTLCLGVPCGVLLFFVRNEKRKPLALLIAMVIAVLIPLLTNLHTDTDRNTTSHWIGSFLASTFAFSTFFKCMAVAFEQYPEGITDDANFYTFVLWYVSLPEPVIAKSKLGYSPRHKLMQKLGLFGVKIIGLFAVLSWIQWSNNHATTSIAATTASWSKQSFILSLWDGYINLWFIYLFSSFCLDFSSLANSFLSGGVEFETGFRNPLLMSRSFGEAWGQRYNLPVHTFLKRSVYVPIRRLGGTQATAVMSTFLASGLLHEYNFSIHNAAYYEPCKVTAFFVFMGGAIIIVEQWLYPTYCPSGVKKIVQMIPSPMIATTLILVAALGPFQKLFVQSWLKAGAVDAVSKMLPHMVCTS